jgi:hypothetical protein
MLLTAARYALAATVLCVCASAQAPLRVHAQPPIGTGVLAYEEGVGVLSAAELDARAELARPVTKAELAEWVDSVRDSRAAEASTEPDALRYSQSTGTDPPSLDGELLAYGQGWTRFGQSNTTAFGRGGLSGGSEGVCGPDAPFEYLPLGWNSDIHAYYTNYWITPDRMLMAGMWTPFPSTAPATIADFALDSDGLPTQDIPRTINSVARTLRAPLFTGLEAMPGDVDEYPPGQYVVEWTGTGCDINLIGDGTSGATVGNRFVHTVADNAATGALFIEIAVSDDADPCDDIRVWMPGLEDSPLTLHPDWAVKAGQFDAFRFMNIARSNSHENVHLTTTWASRVPTTYFSQATEQRGASLEWQVAACNELDVSTCWFNVHHATTSNYWTNASAYLQANVEAGKTIIVELSNEYWNGIFRVNRWLVEQGVALNLQDVGPFAGVGDPEEQTIVPWVDCTTPCRSARAWTATKMYARQLAAFSIDVQANCPRCQVVQGAMAGSQAQADAVIDSLVDVDVNPLYVSGTAAQYVDLLAIAPYFGTDTGADLVLDPEIPIADVCTGIISDAATETASYLAANKVHADAIGVPIVAYEGGFAGDWIEQERATEVRNHACMAEAQLAQLSAWLAGGGGLFNVLGFIDACELPGDGCWGAYQHQAATAQESPTLWGLHAYYSALDEDEDTECEENEPPFVTAGLDVTCDAGDPCLSAVAAAYDDNFGGSTLACLWTESCSGTCSWAPNATTVSATLECADDQTCTRTLTCDDGTADPVADTASIVFEDSGPEPTVAYAGVDGTGFVGLAFAITGTCTPGASSTWSSATCTFDDATDDLTTNATCSSAGANTITLTCDDGVNTPDPDTATWTLTLLFDEGIAITPNFQFSVSDQLRAAYAASAYLARRHDTDATQGIGFTSTGTVNTSALATFCSGTTCSVQTLYDQGLHDNDASGTPETCDVTQATEANQPVVYESGAVVTCGTSNTPCMRFDGTDFLARGDSCGFAGNEHVWMAFHYRFSSGGADRSILFVGTGVGTSWFTMTNPSGGLYWNSALNGNEQYTPSPVTSTWASHISEKPNALTIGDATWETNGVALAVANSVNPGNSTNLANTNLVVGAIPGGTFATIGWIGSPIAGDDDLTGADLTFVRAWQAARN